MPYNSKEKAKNWRTRNRKWVSVYNKKYRRKNKEKLNGYYLRRGEFINSLRVEKGNKCSLCGYCKVTGILQFHHLGNKEFEIASYRGQLNEKIIEKFRIEAQKCILLCPNCHWEITLADINNKKND